MWTPWTFVLLLPLENIPQSLGIKNTVLWGLRSMGCVFGKGEEGVTPELRAATPNVLSSPRWVVT